MWIWRMKAEDKKGFEKCCMEKKGKYCKLNLAMQSIENFEKDNSLVKCENYTNKSSDESPVSFPGAILELPFHFILLTECFPEKEDSITLCAPWLHSTGQCNQLLHEAQW